MPGKTRFFLASISVLLCFENWPQILSQEPRSNQASLPVPKEERLQGRPEMNESPCARGLLMRSIDDIVKGSRRYITAEKLKLGKNRWVMVVDGKEGPEYEEIDYQWFSDDGRRLAYTARRGKNRWVMVVDGKEGPEYEGVTIPRFSPDSRHIAYGARRGQNRWFIVLDGIEGPEYESAPDPYFSPDGNRFAYSAHRGGKQRIVVEGKEVPGFEALTNYPRFSPDSQHIAFPARPEQEQGAVMVLDGKAGPRFDTVAEPIFSPLGVVYVAERGKKCIVVVDGKEGPEVDALSTRAAYTQKVSSWDSRPFRFSPNGQRIAYLARRGDKRFIVVDGQEGPGFPFIFAGPHFSSDSQHVAYIAEENGTMIGILDGKVVNTCPHPKGTLLYTASGRGVELRDYASTADSLGELLPYTAPAVLAALGVASLKASNVIFVPYPAISADGQKLAYVAGYGGPLFAAGTSSKAHYKAIVEGQEGKLYDEILWPGLCFADGNSVIYQAREGKVYYQVTQSLR